MPRMPFVIVFLAALIPVAPVMADDGPTLGEFLRVRAPSKPTVVRSGPHYFLDWPDGVTQLYGRAAGDTPADPLVRLTNFPDGIEDYDVSPSGRLLMITASTGGSEQSDLFLLDTRDGSVRPLKSDPNIVYRFQHWLRDESGFIYAANESNPADMHLFRYDLASGEVETVLAEPGYWTLTDVADDDTRYLVGRYRSAAEAEAFELERVTRRLRPLRTGPTAYERPVSFFDAGRQALFISDHEDGVRRLYGQELESGRVERVLPSLDPYEIETVVTNRQRAVLAATYNDDGQRRVFLARLPDFDVIPAPLMPPGVVDDVAIRGRVLTWTLSNQRDPGRPYASKVSFEPIVMELAVVDDQGIDLGAQPLPKAVSYPGVDGRDIPALLHLPADHETGTPIPFVVMYHGGPESQARPSFDPFVGYLVSRGYGVLRPNVRGSTGYGRAYHQLDNGPGRMDAVRDGVAAADWLIGEGLARPGSIAAYGRSYGGFMALAVSLEAPDTFGACVDVVGIVNFETFLERTKAYRRALREAEYGSLDDRELLRSLSPIHRVNELTVPVLIAHGLNDPRVPVEEAMQLAVALQRLDRDPELIFFPDEGHRIAKLENRELLFERVMRFFERTIGR